VSAFFVLHIIVFVHFNLFVVILMPLEYLYINARGSKLGIKFVDAEAFL
jgi:hypothetical protein